MSSSIIDLQQLRQRHDDLTRQRQDLADARLRADVDLYEATTLRDQRLAQIQEVENQIHDIDSNYDEGLRRYWAHNNDGPKEREVGEGLEGHRELDLGELLTKKMRLEAMADHSRRSVERARRILEEIEGQLSVVIENQTRVQQHIAGLR